MKLESHLFADLSKIVYPHLFFTSVGLMGCTIQPKHYPHMHLCKRINPNPTLRIA